MTRVLDRCAGASQARRALALACSLLAMVVAMPAAAAQEAAPTRAKTTPTAEEPKPAAPSDPRIVVIGQRTIVAVLKDIQPEDVYDESRVASYNASTIGELLDQIRGENGDDDPAVLINGQPVRDLGDIADIPVEAIRGVEQLPRGAAQRIGGAAAQRAYNIVLKPAVQTLTLTGSTLLATEGGYAQAKGEALGTYIRGQDRLNLTLRRSVSDPLLESERGIAPRAEAYPYSVLGNAIPFSGTQVDPALSARLGRPVTIVGLPGTRLTAADLAMFANLPNASSAPAYRSLRGASRPWEAAVAGNKQLGERWSLSINSRLSWIESESLRGLPSARFLLPAANAFTPFTTPVFIALSDPARPLRSLSENEGKSVSATLNGNLGQWHATLLARYDERRSTYTTDTNGLFPGGFYTVPIGTDPFAGTLAGLIPVTSSRSTSRNVDRQLTADADGPLAALPAGALLGRLGVGALWNSYEADDAFSGARRLTRRELTAKAGITIPLTGESFLSALGTSDLAIDLGRLDLGRFGAIDRYTVALNWAPAPWLRLTASQQRDGTAIYSELLSAPVVVTDNVPYFDPVRNETAYVRLVTGGATSLRNPIQRTRNLAVTAAPMRKYNLRLTLEYQESSQRNLLGSLPFPSSAIVAAFPDRFVRDGSGRLVQIDTTTVNFDRQDSRQVRFGVSMGGAIMPAQTIARTKTTPMRRIPALNFQFNLSHTHLLDSTTVIRAGLPEIDLLSGGAIGIGGGGQRDFTNASLSVTQGATGLRLDANYRGPSSLQIGTPTAPDRLTFAGLFQLDMRMFADLGQLLPGDRMAKGTRLSVVFDNLLDDRQRVTNLSGLTPQAYQPVYRDPVGRTVMLELRKVF